MTALLAGLRALGAARLAAMGAVALGMLGVIALLAMRGGNDRMALLYGELDLRDSAAMVEQLGRQHIAYQVAGQGSSILVPAEQVANARLALAREGLPAGGSIGYEIFDRGEGIAASQFQQQINQTRAMEGELARSIRTIQGVRAARVHLVLGKREPFARDRQEAQASVLLTMTGAARLDREAVSAVLNLVSAAVPGLKAENVSIIDNRGTLLARAGQAGGGASSGPEELKRATELRLARAVEDMLEPSLGPGRIRAEASVDMDFSKVSETSERYDPDGQVPRSTQSVTTTSRSTEPSATVSVQNNLPNANAANPDTPGSQESRQEETTNFEITKTVRTLVREQPQIRKLSLAVIVDGVDEPGADGKTVWRPRTPEELARITALVRGAVGFDEQRGDRVEVTSMRLGAGEDAPPAEPRGPFGLPMVSRTDLLRLAETGLLGVVALLALVFVLRPMVLRLTALAGPVPAGGGGLDAAMTLAALPAPDMRAPGPGQGASGSAPLRALAGSPGLPMLEDESMVSLANVEGQMRASSIRRIAEMVEQHPDESIGIMRSWMLAESG